MSRRITDESLLTWEVYPSGGAFGLPADPMIVFNCLSDADRRARYVRHDGDDAGAQRAVREMGDSDLNDLLAESRELD